MNYDPMTGEPIEEEKEQVKFDPMTGEPIQPGTEEEVNFDPMTGEPIRKTMAPMSGESNKKALTKPALIGTISAITVVVVAVIVVLCVVLSNPHMKILRACGKTFGDSGKLVEAFTKYSPGYAEDATIANTVSYEGSDIDVVFSVAKDKVQAKIDADIKSTPKMEGILQIDTKEVSATLPSISDTVFIYDYTEEATGYLAETIGKRRLEEINQSISDAMNSSNMQKDIYAKLSKEYLKQYKTWDVEKTKKQSFKVDGKRRECQGYSLLVTKQNIKDLVSATEDIYEDTFENGTFSEFEDSFDALMDEAEKMKTTEIVFYIYRGKLACVDYEDGLVTAYFGNSKNWLMDFELEVDEKEFFAISGETNKSEESYELSFYDGYSRNNETSAELNYDYKTGEFSFYLDDVEVSGTLISSRNSFELGIDKVKDHKETLDFIYTLNMKKGAKFEKITGERFDLGTASERDFRNLVEEYSDSLEEFTDGIEDMGMDL